MWCIHGATSKNKRISFMKKVKIKPKIYRVLFLKLSNFKNLRTFVCFFGNFDVFRSVVLNTASVRCEQLYLS